MDLFGIRCGEIESLSKEQVGMDVESMEVSSYRLFFWPSLVFFLRKEGPQVSFQIVLPEKLSFLMDAFISKSQRLCQLQNRQQKQMNKECFFVSPPPFLLGKGRLSLAQSLVALQFYIAWLSCPIFYHFSGPLGFNNLLRTYPNAVKVEGKGLGVVQSPQKVSFCQQIHNSLLTKLQKGFINHIQIQNLRIKMGACACGG